MKKCEAILGAASPGEDKQRLSLPRRGKAVPLVIRQTTCGTAIRKFNFAHFFTESQTNG